MKGLLLLFFGIVLGGGAYSYMDKASKRLFWKFLRNHLVLFLVAIMMVSVAIFFSLNVNTGVL